MGRKTNKQLLQEQKNSFLTVAQAIELLKTMPSDSFLGKTGHFGEFHGIHKCDFHSATAYITPNDSWRNEIKEDVNIVDITAPDIGPDPD